MAASYALDPLPRRSFLGVQVRSPKQADSAGLEVLHVVAGGTAGRVGVRVGDRLLAIDGVSVVDANELLRRSRALRSGDSLTLKIARGNGAEIIDLSGIAVPLPHEAIDGAIIEHSHVVVGGGGTDGGDVVRLRAISTRPMGKEPGNITTVMILPGLGGTSCEIDDPNAPDARLIAALTAGGLATFRVERSGLGDSEGPPHADTDFFTELAGYRAGLEWLAADAEGRRRRTNSTGGGSTVIFGPSIGGMFAPMLADPGSGVAGVIVFGTSSTRWLDCIIDSTRRQRGLQGLVGEELATYVTLWTELHERVVIDGLTPEEIFADSCAPHLRAFLENSTAARGAHLFGRHVRFFQQLDRLNLDALWSTVEAPVLVIHGEYDAVCAPSEGERIAGSLVQRGRYCSLPNIAHDMRRHASLDDCVKRPREGVWDGQVPEAILAWCCEEGLMPP